MVVLIVESAPASLRGELSKWMLEPRAGVFVGQVSALVRDLLYEKACREVENGGVTLIYSTNNEQGYAIRSYGDTTRQIEEWEGLYLVRRPNPTETPHSSDDGRPPESSSPKMWSELRDPNNLLHPVIWAKTSRGGRWGIRLAPGEAPWHPLIAHMIDVAMVALSLWQYLLPPLVRRQMRESLGLESTEAAGRWVAFFAGLHDLGKASPGFAFRWKEAEERLLAAGYKPSTTRRIAPHGFVSAARIPEVLGRVGIVKPNGVAIGRAVGGHHGLIPSAVDIEEAIDSIGGGRWRQVQEDLAFALAHVLQIDALPVPSGDLLSDSAFLIRLAGLTSVADWIGSNHDHFPFVGDGVRLPDYARYARIRALRALLELGWFHRPKEYEAKPFHEVFYRQPNRLQSTVEKLVDELDGPSLVLLEYPMGGGKTEAALYLASMLQASHGHQGLYVALPTMATSNQMFTRVSRYLYDQFPNQRVNLQLLHGRADLNPTFARLLERGRGLRDNPVIGDGLDGEANLLAAEWFTHRKQGLLAPFSVGTIDQALLAALDTKHYFVRLFGLAGKVVVFDEVHAYDTYMQSLLGQLLTWLAACGSSVILLSATLPSRVRDDLIQDFARGLGHTGPLEIRTSAYPRVTWVSRRDAGSRHIEGAPQRTVLLRHVASESTGWMEALRERLSTGGCAAVLCNTVGRAQETYQSLQAHFSADELMLFHARYPFDDRMALEQAVIRRFGNTGDDRPHRMVCVATQIIEQSLDIDFDLMVSEMAPIDLVLQRSGRLWRHPRARPPQLTGPELWLLLPPLSPDGLPEWDRPTTFVYDEHLLLRSYLVLKELSEFHVPGDVERLIEDVYQVSPPPGGLSPALAAYWLRTSDQMERGDMRHRREAAVREIPDLDVQIVDYDPVGLEEDAEELHAAHRAMTRLGGPSVEVVCLYERDGHVYTSPTATAPLDLGRRPDLEDILTLLGRSVRLSFNPALVKRILQLPVPLEWQVTPHLRKHRLLLFAPDGKCLTENLPLELHPVLGLRQRDEEMEVST